jgi:hypothetical protein
MLYAFEKSKIASEPKTYPAKLSFKKTPIMHKIIPIALRFIFSFFFILQNSKEFLYLNQ